MMLRQTIESTLEMALARVGESAPPRLLAAMRHAVLPGGGRVRPRLCLRVARACSGGAPRLAVGAAVAVELLHCASLVHDDLPAFDDAATRRGMPSVHRAFGEPLAVLAGDGLIVLAFEELARAAANSPERLPAVLTAVTRGAGAAQGIVGGQAWESEPFVELRTYHRLKTAALFEAAVAAGAAACGEDPAPWVALGTRIGEAYQVADDLADAVGSADQLGKPVGQDASHGRPSAVATLGIDAAAERWRRLVRAAADAVPPCRGRDELRAWIAAAMSQGPAAAVPVASAG